MGSLKLYSDEEGLDLSEQTNRAKAYSYLRFSTPDQMRGDSFRRQTDAAREYAELNGLDLDGELSFRDLGGSAYQSKLDE